MQLNNLLTPELLHRLRRIAWLLLLFGTAVVVISAVEKRWTSTATHTDIHVEPIEGGHYLITDKDVKKIIEKSFDGVLTGRQLDEIDIERLERVLEQIAFILDADVYMDARQRLNVVVVQRQPMVRIMDNNGLDYYLDVNGQKMPASEHYTARVLVATGSLPPFTSDFLERPGHTLNQLFQLTKRLRHDELLRPLVEQVHFKKGDFILIPKIADHKIIIGTTDQLEDKIERLKIFYKEGLSRIGWRKYNRIDLRFDKQVVAGK